MKKNHLEHLHALKENKDFNTLDKDRAIEGYAKKIRMRKGRDKKKVSIKIAELVWNAQSGLPIYYIEHNGIPMTWNSPMRDGWGLKHIKYEICHDLAVNMGGTNCPTNLFYGSAQCNRVHGALSISDWVSFLDKKTITERYERVKALHKTKQFLDLLAELNM
jgi:hypothetical protein